MSPNEILDTIQELMENTGAPSGSIYEQWEKESFEILLDLKIVEVGGEFIDEVALRLFELGIDPEIGMRLINSYM